jgi:hypothetical protein
MLDAAADTERRAVLRAEVEPNPPLAELKIEPPAVTRATVLGVLFCHSVRFPDWLAIPLSVSGTIVVPLEVSMLDHTGVFPVPWEIRS